MRFRGSRVFWTVALCGWLAGFGLGCSDSSEEATPADVSSGGANALSNASSPRLRVKAAEVRLEALSSGGNVVGTVRAFRRARVTAETQGRVVARAVEPGTEVSEGDALVELDATKAELELRRAQAALRSAVTVRDHAQREFDRGERLASESAISAQRRDDLRLGLDRAKNELSLAAVARDTARRSLQDTRVEAPFDGVVDSIEVDAGDYVSPGAFVATVVDFSKVRIFGGVTAKEAARLRVDSEAVVSFEDLGGRSFPATLKRVGRVADVSDGTFEIELWLAGGDEGALSAMRDGLVARIELPAGTEVPVLLAPRAALLRRDGRPEVFVVESTGRRRIARARIIETGRSDGDWIEVVDGLKEGDRIVFDGHFALQDGSEVELDGVALSAADERE